MIQKIAIINGDPDVSENQLTLFLQKLTEKLDTEGYNISYFSLSDKEIKSCIGCWDCWWKTPGICRHKDGVQEILKEIISSDIVIYASPLLMGMYSGLLKTFHDKTIPLVHPYIEINKWECHHTKRYPKYPKIGVVVENGDATNEEIENVKYIFDRIALNFHSEIKFFKSLHQTTLKEISHAISHI